MLACPSLPLEITRFLGLFDSTSSAHSREQLGPAEKGRLEAFAQGRLADTERRELLDLLSSNTEALEYLAALLHAQADPSGEEE